MKTHHSHGLRSRRWMLMALLAGAGCALTGKTKPVEVQVDAGEGRVPPLRVVSVELEPGQTKLTNVGTFAWGEYGEKDLATLRISLEQAVAPFAGPGGEPAMGIHVVVRRFLVAHSNNEALALACVSWALTSPAGELLAHEQFYASDYVKHWGTLGGIKNDVHEGIVGRVAQRAVLAATGSEAAPAPVEHAHDSFEAAAAGLPSQLTSVHANALMLGGGYTLLVHRYRGGSDLAWARQPEHIDWATRLRAASS